MHCFVFQFLGFQLFFMVGCYAALNGIQDWRSAGILTDTINYILDDLSWLQTSFSYNPKWFEIKPCDDYNAINDEIYHDTEPDSEWPVEETAPSVFQTISRQLDEIWKTSGILDFIQLDIYALNTTTWCLFFTSFILTVLLCIRTILSKEQELPVYETSPFKPRSRALYRKTKNPIEKRHQSLSPRRRYKLRRKKTISAHLVEKQIQTYLSEQDTNRKQNILKIRKICPRIFSKKQTKSDLEIKRKQTKVKTPISLEGKIYNLSKPEDIPWDILDILLCIKSSCTDHDHDHVCVVGNHVYTIPKWSIPNTTRISEKSSPAADSNNDKESRRNSAENDEKDEELSTNTIPAINTFQPIKPAPQILIDVTDLVERPQAVHAEDTMSLKSESEHQKDYLSPIDIQSVRSEEKVTVPRIVVSKPMIDLIGSESTEFENNIFEVNPTTSRDTIIDTESRVHKYIKTIEECINKASAISSEKGKQNRLTSPLDPFLQEPNRIQTPGISESDTSLVLNEDDIGLPCANSSFKSANEELRNDVVKHFLDDTENSWIEDDSFYSSKDHLIHDDTKSNQDLNVSSYIHNVSSRLLKDSQDLHNLSKTLSFYGDVSVLELGASWLIGGLLSQVVDELDISSRAESLVSNISARFNSVPNTSR